MIIPTSGQWKERVKTHTICSAQFLMSTFCSMLRVLNIYFYVRWWVCGYYSVGGGSVDAHIQWELSMTPAACVQLDILFRTIQFPKIQKNGHTLTSPHLHYTNMQPNTKYRHTEKAQADPPCMLLPVTRTCFCEFYRQLHTTVSRIATLKAPEHWLFVQIQQCVGRTFCHTPHHICSYLSVCVLFYFICFVKYLNVYCWVYISGGM